MHGCVMAKNDESMQLLRHHVLLLIHYDDVLYIKSQPWSNWYVLICWQTNEPNLRVEKEARSAWNTYSQKHACDNHVSATMTFLSSLINIERERKGNDKLTSGYANSIDRQRPTSQPYWRARHMSFTMFMPNCGDNWVIPQFECDIYTKYLRFFTGLMCLVWKITLSTPRELLSLSPTLFDWTYELHHGSFKFKPKSCISQVFYSPYVKDINNKFIYNL